MIMRITALTLAITASFSINTLAQNGQFDLLQTQAVEQEKNRSVMNPPERELTRSAKIDNSKQVYLTPVLGTPQFFWANSAVKKFKAKKAKHTNTNTMHRSAGRHYVKQYKSLLGIKDAGERGLKYRSVSQPVKDKAITVSYDQYINGVPVLGGGVNLLMDKHHKLIAVGATVASQTRAIGNEQKFTLNKGQAIATAIENLINEKISSNNIVVDSSGKKAKLTGPVNGWNLSSDVVVKKVFYPQKNHVLSAYQISVRVNKAGSKRGDRKHGADVRHYGYIISASDGKILQKKNYSHSVFHRDGTDFSYLVYADRATKLPQDGPDGNNGSPHPTGTPDGFQAAFATQNLLTMQHADIHTKDPWLPAGATQTKGNNVDAYIDASAPDGFSPNTNDMRAKVNVNNEFNFVFDPTKDANANDTQKQAAVTNLFYTINYLHDVFYNAGFDEASGNAQLKNYGRGGQEGDPILAEGQDFSGLNNANMSTPPDGQSPVMQQYLFQGRTKVTIRFDNDKAYELINSQSGLGQTSYDTKTSVAFVMPNNASHDICQPFTNGADFAGKVLVANYKEACELDTLYESLNGVSPVVAMLINDRVLPPTFDTPTSSGKVISYGVIDIDSGTESISTFVNDVAAGGVSGYVSAKNKMFRDSTLSNLVIMHEWGHYIHGRLAGNGEGPGNNVYGGGMGEGFGDFIALMHQVREEDLTKPGGDNYNGVYAQGGWTDGSSVDKDNQAYYFGIRRVPYTTDMSKNALTYRHFRLDEALPSTHPIANSAKTVTDVGAHSQGEIWATTLFEAFMGLARDTDRLTLKQAKERMRQYLVSGMKLIPADATYLLARDTIIASAVANDIKDAKIIAKAFAKRGMGTGATSPAVSSSDLKEGLTESFETTSFIQARALTFTDIAETCDTDKIWDPTEVAELDLNVYNSGIETLAGGDLVISSNDKITIIDGSSISHKELAPYAQEQLKVKVKLNEDAVFNKHVTLSVASKAQPDRKVDFSFATNYDIGLSNKETFEISVDNDEDKKFVNWINTRKLENNNLDDGAWFGNLSADTKSKTVKIWPYTGKLDESLESPELDVASDADFVMSFDHVYITRNRLSGGLAGGLIEVQIAGGKWTNIDDNSITRYKLDGSELGKGYGGKVSADAGTKVDGENAFVGQNVTEEEMENRAAPLRKVSVNFARAYAGKKVKVRFRFFSADADGEANDFWELDNIEFKGLNKKVIDKSVIENVKLCKDNVAPVLTLSATAGTFANNSLKAPVKAGESIVLNAKATDINNDSLTYKWSQTSGESIKLSDTSKSSLTVRIPGSAKAGLLKFKVTVSDGKLSTTSDATLTVTPKKSSGSIGMFLLLAGFGLRFSRKNK